MKVADLEKLYNVVVENFFIWIHLEPQTINLNSIEDNTRGKKIYIGHKWVWDTVVWLEEYHTRGGHGLESHLPLKHVIFA